MSANGSQEKLGLLMRVATSRLDLIDEADTLACQVNQQVDHLKNLKTKAFSIPVIGSIVGTLGGIVLIRMIMGGKKSQTPAPACTPSGIMHSPFFRLVIEILISMAFPSLKKMGINFAQSKLLNLFRFNGN